MPKHPDDEGRDEPGNFFQRWSQRKADAAKGSAQEAPAAAPGDDTNPSPVDHTDNTTDEASTEAPATPPSVTEADLENLTYDSDYTKFMGEEVPDALRRRALRQLWRSDPVLANVDGLCDYDDDYTDAALAVKVLQTAHRVGQGYLTDDEVAANQALGNPEQAITNADDETEEFDDGEDIEETGNSKPDTVDDDDADALAPAGDNKAPRPTGTEQQS